MTTYTDHQQAWSALSGPPLDALNSCAARSMRCAIAGLPPPTPDPPPLDTVIPGDLTGIDMYWWPPLIAIDFSCEPAPHELLWFLWFPDWSGAPPPSLPRFNHGAIVAPTALHVEFDLDCVPSAFWLLCRVWDHRDGTVLDDSVYHCLITQGG